MLNKRLNTNPKYAHEAIMKNFPKWSMVIGIGIVLISTGSTPADSKIFNSHEAKGGQIMHWITDGAPRF